jgi:hypothetical protein
LERVCYGVREGVFARKPSKGKSPPARLLDTPPRRFCFTPQKVDHPADSRLFLQSFNTVERHISEGWNG